MSSTSLNMVAERLLEAVIAYYGSGEYVVPFQSKDRADCVVRHAAAGGVAMMGAMVLPGVGGIISGGTASVVIWSMYVKICKMIGVPFGKNKLKALASALLTNLATQFAGMFALSFIPGVGAIASGAINFAVTYFAGLIFLIMLTKLFRTQRKDILDFSDDEWKESLKTALSEIDKKAVMRDAKELFKSMKNDGSLERVGKSVELENDE